MELLKDNQSFIAITYWLFFILKRFHPSSVISPIQAVKYPAYSCKYDFRFRSSDTHKLMLPIVRLSSNAWTFLRQEDKFSNFQYRYHEDHLPIGFTIWYPIVLLISTHIPPPICIHFYHIGFSSDTYCFVMVLIDLFADSWWICRLLSLMIPFCILVCIPFLLHPLRLLHNFPLSFALYIYWD